MPTSYTESEAQERKWCPLAMVAEPRLRGDVPVNRPEKKQTPRCWGSDCMFWQWDHHVTSECKHPDEPEMPRRGYCGMAVR